MSCNSYSWRYFKGSLSQLSMHCSPGADWSEVVPETERLDTSAHRAKAHLAQRSRRQPPSRSKLKETLSSPVRSTQVTQSSRNSWLLWKIQYISFEQYIFFDLRVMMRVSLRVPSLHCLVGDQSRRVCPCRSSYLPLLTTRRMKVLLQAAANQCRGILKAPPFPLLKTPPPPVSCGM